MLCYYCQKEGQKSSLKIVSIKTPKINKLNSSVPNTYENFYDEEGDRHCHGFYKIIKYKCSNDHTGYIYEDSLCKTCNEIPRKIQTHGYMESYKSSIGTMDLKFVPHNN